jgi:hypothetical protein
VRGAAGKESFHEAFPLDKRRSALAGMLLHAGRRGHFMLVDDDDLVSARLAQCVAANADANGWYISEGYFWTDGRPVVHRDSQFSRYCGASHIGRADLYGLHLHRCQNRRASFVRRTTQRRDPLEPDPLTTPRRADRWCPQTETGDRFWVVRRAFRRCGRR